MPTQRDHWPVWAQYLRNRGLDGLAAWLLDAGAPFTLIGAQILYVGQPFLSPFVPAQSSQALAQLLEDREESLAFIEFLRDGAAS